MIWKSSKYLKAALLLLTFTISNKVASFAQDTLRVMSYNVDKYGDYPLCNIAVSNGTLHGYFSTIVQYTDPDIIGLVKAGAIGTKAPTGFADSIVAFALNPAYAGRYLYCPFYNAAGDNALNLLFYNQQKLGFVAVTCVYSNLSDFPTYKLYYKDPNLATVHDTTFLYVTLNHDQSGSGNASIRGGQIAGEMQQIQSRFSHLPNMLNMGDFNLRNTSEQVYQVLTNPSDTGFKFYDGPFYDNLLTYPADWDNNQGPYAAYMTTSTRDTSLSPAGCDVTGGAKDWFDHIFMSPWIVQNANYIKYIPHSYRTIGNDGSRLSFSTLDGPPNISAPANVLNAVYRLSDKYPIMVNLAVTYNTAGTSPVDPEYPLAIAKTGLSNPQITIVNPVSEKLIFFVPKDLQGQMLSLECYDALGRTVMQEKIIADKDQIQIPCSLPIGVYFVRIFSTENILYSRMIFKR